jgi:hypothetical protein
LNWPPPPRLVRASQRLNTPTPEKDIECRYCTLAGGAMGVVTLRREKDHAGDVPPRGHVLCVPHMHPRHYNVHVLGRVCCTSQTAVHNAWACARAPSAPAHTLPGRPSLSEGSLYLMCGDDGVVHTHACHRSKCRSCSHADANRLRVFHNVIYPIAWVVLTSVASRTC